MAFILLGSRRTIALKCSSDARWAVEKKKKINV